MSHIVTKRPGKQAEVTEQSGHIEYEQLKEALDHCTFTMVQIRVEYGGNAHWVDVYCDDEGLLKELQFNFFHQQYNQPIVGPVLCCQSDEEGNSVSIDEDLAKATAEVLNNWGSVVPVFVG